MERASEPLLSFGPPAEGGPPVPMDLSQSKQPRPPSEAEQTGAQSSRGDLSVSSRHMHMTRHQASRAVAHAP
eukprot:scaffold91982_cov30-Tisochrysis_lutea.AAC.3